MARVTGETLIDRLNYLDELIQQADDASLAALASSELGRLTQTLLALLGDHAPNRQGRCRRCRRSRWHLWRRPRPCRVWDLAYLHLVTAPPARPTGPVLVVGGPR